MALAHIPYTESWGLKSCRSKVPGKCGFHIPCGYEHSLFALWHVKCPYSSANMKWNRCPILIVLLTSVFMRQCSSCELHSEFMKFCRLGRPRSPTGSFHVVQLPRFQAIVLELPLLPREAKNIFLCENACFFTSLFPTMACTYPVRTSPYFALAVLAVHVAYPLLLLEAQATSTGQKTFLLSFSCADCPKMPRPLTGHNKCSKTHLL